MAQTKWYYGQAGEETGPLNGKQLLQAVQSGAVQTDTPLRKEGMDHSVEAGSVSGLFEKAQQLAASRSAVAESQRPAKVQKAQELEEAEHDETAATERSATRRRARRNTDRNADRGTSRTRRRAQAEPGDESNPFRAPVEDDRAPSRARSDQRSRSGKEFTPAGFWIRVGAYVIDYVFRIIITVIVAFGLGMAAAFIAPSSSQDTMVLAISVIAYIPLIFYSFILEGRYSATWGKSIVGIRVVTNSGDPIGYGKSFMRNLIFGLLSIIPIAQLINYIIIGTDKQKKGWHDKAGGTRVVYKATKRSRRR